ncbi:MAG: hypothetical protein A2161_05215 [Candidatus Schekmanbacteria bacterium RBG_13_48_7]|uniref:DUF3037 domain-containing protein n=1 Tax=Candidatus Schekmanbacteria bacterium RBG_13_48_7 TaxID=1817878 RepID=A0A1F7RLW6_9BACT|nr:MAG: hypothetical protein A2161_05215 [Candidatus Schekmanbacteria bacterium RBG_13_48_7]
MSSIYTYTVLRYMHDIQTEEFVNVGVVIYCPDQKILKSRITTFSRRISSFFKGIDRSVFLVVVDGIKNEIGILAEKIFLPVMVADLPKDVLTCVSMAMPKNESVIQFSRQGGGITDNADDTLNELFKRYVEKYLKERIRQTRSDDQVLPILRDALTQKGLSEYVRTKRVSSSLDEHDFPIAWKNGKWNLCDAISFDLSVANDIRGKANRWLGHTFNLFKNNTDYKLYLFLGKPSIPELSECFDNAVKILNQIPGNPSLICEENVSDIVDQIKKDYDQQEKGITDNN